MILALLAAAAAQQPQASAGAIVQASASVRIIAGRRLTLGASTADAELRQTRVRDIDGQPKPAKLIEFQ